MFRLLCGCALGLVVLAATLAFSGAEASGQDKAQEKPEWVRPPIKADHLHHKTFRSETIKGDVSYLIYLPPEYEKAKEKRYPVMYWLHGRGGSQQGVPAFTQRLTKAIEAGKTPPMIAVFVNGLITSGYEDREGQPVETVSIKELIPHIDKTYRTLAGREGRIVEGFSMGGGGAAKWGFKYPELFGAVSILAGARMTGEGATASAFLKKNADAVRGKTAIRIVVGSQDGLVKGNREYHELLEELKVPHDFHVIDGASHAHPPLYDGLGDKNWEFYRQALGQTKVQPKEPSPPPKGVKVERDLEYARVGDKKLLLDLYLPEKAEGPLPVIIGIHGGAWMAGSKDGGAGRHHAGRGYAVAVLNYRLSGEAIFPAQIEDCKSAVRWLRANAKKYNLDPDRFGATGHSAGGHLSSLLGFNGSTARSPWLKAPSGRGEGKLLYYASPGGGKLKHDAPGSPESRLIGGLIQENKEKAAQANPITFVSKDDPPFLLIHGDQDVVVPAHQAQLLDEALRKAGIEVKLHFIKGAGHQLGGPELNDLTAAFFDKHLKKTPGPGPNKPPPKEPAGFKLDGTRWTFKDDTLAMEGIFLKPEGEGPFPAILISHGKGGNAESFGMNKAKELVKWGLVCIAPNYAHAGGNVKKPEPAGGDGASEVNLRCALRCLDILESLPYVDKKRIGAYGHSMGGFVTIGMAGTAPGRLKACAITGSGIAPKAGFPAPTTELAEKIRTPFLILHGSDDKAVRPAQSAQLKEALDKNKVPNERHVFEGEGHPIDQTKREEVYKLIQQWFTSHGVLKK